MTPSRRDFLKGAAGAAGAVLLGSELRQGPATPALSRQQLPPAPLPTLPTPGQSPIEHVVVVMMENRSFDHFLGWMPGANGIGVAPDGAILDSALYDSFVYPSPKGPAQQIYNELQLNGCGFGDQDHSYQGGRQQYDNGKMDGFLTDTSNSRYAVSYYLAGQRPFMSQLALNYTTCDNYFCSFLGPTYPNRFFQHSAQTDSNTNQTSTTNGPDGTPAPVTMPTIWDQLNQPGGPTGRYYFSDLPFLALWGATYLPISGTYAEFLADASAGTLPNVCFIDPRFEDEGSGTSGDDHPLADIRAGDAFLSDIFHALATGPLWSSTVMVVNYDEWGGFFDHVVPPRVAPGNLRPTPDNPYVDPDVDSNGNVLAGLRVPCIVASPYSLGNAASPTLSPYMYDHSSVLRFIEWNWGLHSLTPRDASIPLTAASTSALTNLAYALDFSSARTSVPSTIPELAPFVSTGCDVPDMPQGGPTAGGQPISASAAPRVGSYEDDAWASLKASGLLKGWV